MRGHWSHKLLAAVLVIMAFAAVVHAAAEVDPCLLDGSQHTGRHAPHACPVCCSAWIDGPSVPAVAPVFSQDTFDPPADCLAASPDHALVPSPRGPPSFHNA